MFSFIEKSMEFSIKNKWFYIFSCFWKYSTNGLEIYMAVIDCFIGTSVDHQNTTCHLFYWMLFYWFSHQKLTGFQNVSQLSAIALPLFYQWGNEKCTFTTWYMAWYMIYGMIYDMICTFTVVSIYGSSPRAAAALHRTVKHCRFWLEEKTKT